MTNIKSLRKIFLLMIIFIFIAFCFLQNKEVSALTTTGNASYNVTETKEINKLPYGVVHTRDLGLTTKANKTTNYAQQVNVLTVPSLTGVKIVSWANTNNHIWTLTSVRKLAKDYEAKHPGYTVIAAINGDFFDIGGNGNLKFQTTGAVVADGHFYKTTSGNTVGFTNDGSKLTLIGNKKIERTEAMVLAVYDENDNIVSEFDVLTLNGEPQDNGASVYFGVYNSDHQYVPQTVPQVDGATIFTVGAADKALPNNANDFYGIGTIDSNDTATLQKGQFSIVSKNAEINAALKVGKKIRIQYEYTGAYANITAATGGGVCVLKNSEAPSNIETALPDTHPRTGIGVKEDGTIVMAVIDGRQSDKGMNGVGGAEMSSVMKNYGCTEAYNLDGGGSSTLCILEKGELVVKNSPSDGWERSDSNCLLVVAKDPEYEVTTKDVVDRSLTVCVNVKNNNGHTFDKLYASINGVEVEVVDGCASFSRLTALTKYTVKVYYKNDKGAPLYALNDFSVSTSAIPYKFRGVDIKEDDSSYSIELDYTDRGNATNLATAKLTVNGKEYTLQDGKVVVQKSDVGQYITEMTLTFTNIIVDGTEEITLVNPHSKLIAMMEELSQTLKDFIDEIYG